MRRLGIDTRERRARASNVTEFLRSILRSFVLVQRREAPNFG